MNQENFLNLIIHMSENEKNLHMRIGLINWLGLNYNSSDNYFI